METFHSGNLFSQPSYLTSAVTLSTDLRINCISCMYLPNPSTCAGCDTKSIFKQSLTGLNLNFLSSRLVAIPRLKESVCPTICPYLRRRNGRIPTFFKSISSMWNANYLVQDLYLGYHPFPQMMTNISQLYLLLRDKTGPKANVLRVTWTCIW